MILVGDCRERLRELPAGSVQTCITSPPYFGLRDYGTGRWEGGDQGCDHVEREIRTGLGLAEWSAEHAAGGGHKAGEVDQIQFRDVCGKCGARRVDRQLGLEPSPDEFVAALVDVFREVRRVLRDDGTVWLNLGDSYAGGGRARGKDRDAIYGPSKQGTNPGSNFLDAGPVPAGCKPKDLVGIPWMVAFALRSDGWYLRSEIVWAKPNPMPESVTDRPTSAHEKVFLLSRRPRYFYDADAIREPDAGTDHPRNLELTSEVARGDGFQAPDRGIRTAEGRNGSGRNKRNVWEIATRPYAEAHFATFPPKLVEPCVLAGAPTGGMVLDPFAGSGTVGVVCAWHGREFVGVELNPEYAAMAERRIATEGRLGRAPRRVQVEQDALFEA